MSEMGETERIAILLQMEKEQFEKHARSAQGALERLERRVDPLAAAEKRLEKEQRRYNAALAKGSMDAKEHQRAMDLLQREFEQTRAKIEGTTDAMRRMGAVQTDVDGVLQRNKGAFQQLGYQVGDFAVQVQGGTSAAVAFTQQGSQMLGALGPMGAIMGAALAVGVPLAGALLASGDASEEVAEEARSLTEAINAYITSADAASVSTEELEGRYYSTADAARAWLKAMAEADRVEALEAINRDLDALAAKMGGFGTSFSLPVDQIDASLAELRERLAEARAESEAAFAAGAPVGTGQDAINAIRQQIADMEAFRAEIARISDQYNIAEADAHALAVALNSVANADPLSDKIDAAQALDALLLDIFGSYEDMTGAVRELYVENLKNLERMDAMRGASESTAFAVTDILAAAQAAVPSIAAMSAQAGSLWQNMSGAAAAAWDVLKAQAFAKQAEIDAGGGGGRGGDPRTMGGSALDWQVREADEFLRTYTPPKPSGGGRGGGRGGSGGSGGRTGRISTKSVQDEADKAGEAFGRLLASLDPVVAATQRYEEAQTTVNEALKAGEISAEQAANALGLAEEQMRESIEAADELKQRAQEGAEYLSDMFMGIVDGSMSAKDALRQLLLQLAQVQMQRAFLGMADGGGVLGSLFGALGGALSPTPSIGSNASGTDYWRGGLTRVNEMGGEIMNLPRGTQIIPHDISKRMVDRAAGSTDRGGAIEVRVSLDGKMLKGEIVGTAGPVAAHLIQANNEQLAQNQRRS